ncbi:MAG: hypothetical protein CVU33_15350 [Betaproteobacteria bacterium HGW-Betaproteobacteria-6]|jgi:methyl-accepting chemotaxis protein|nr:MAG: hypothetical protein CVU33_15350 [Betaproteobacteria bacterium HGW-Betaproteobacteria-6]
MQLNIGQKLHLFATIALLALIVMATISLQGTRQANADMKDVVERDVKSLLATQAIDRHLLEIRFRVAGVVLDQLPSVGSQNHLKEARGAIEKRWHEFETAHQAASSEDAELTAKIGEGLKVLPALFDRIDALYSENDNKGLRVLLEDEWPVVISKVQRPLAKLVKINEEALAQQQERGLEEGKRRATFSLVTAGLAAGILIVFAVLLIRSITRTLAKLQDTLVHVEQSGDLTLRVGATRQDEVGRTAAAFDSMMAKITALVGETLHTAEAISAAAQSMAIAGAQVERSSSAQSDAASAVAASIEQASVSISETAGNARTADDTASRARGDIEKTLIAVHQAADNVDTLASMIGQASGDIAHLAESSRRIEGIVKTIKDIADQTNLLALNAAIEAARAGEQGRGFAVVADEVRKLAENTTRATCEISDLIGGIQSEVDAAVARMQEANDKAGTTRERVIVSTSALDAASDNTGRVTESVRNIADAVREQDAAVQQVARRVEQIAQMTEENTAAATNAANTARQLDTLAGKLRQAVGRFTV